MQDNDAVYSPCISDCKMNSARGTAEERAAGGLCNGCLRTLDEIIEWGRATSARKRAILRAIEVRRSIGV